MGLREKAIYGNHLIHLAAYTSQCLYAANFFPHPEINRLQAKAVKFVLTI